MLTWKTIYFVCDNVFFISLIYSYSVSNKWTIEKKKKKKKTGEIKIKHNNIVSIEMIAIQNSTKPFTRKFSKSIRVMLCSSKLKMY